MSASSKGNYRAYGVGSFGFLPTYRETERRFGIMGNSLQEVSSVRIVSEGVLRQPLDPGDYEVQLSAPSSVTLNSNPGNDVLVFVSCKNIVDTDGEEAVTQYPAAALRWVLSHPKLTGVSLSRLNHSSFGDYDTDFPIPTKIYIPFSPNQISGKEIVDAWQACFFSHVLCDEGGNYQVGRYDPDNIPASVATILDDEIIEISQQTEGLKIFNNATIPYAWNIGDDIYKQASKDHPTAMLFFPNSEPFALDRSFIVERADALSVMDLYLAYYGADRPVIAVAATGDCFKALPTQWITLRRTKGFSSTGAIDAQFKVRSIEKILSGATGTAKMVLEPAFTVNTTVESEIVTNELKSGHAEDTTTLTISNIELTKNTIYIKIYYTMSGGDPDISPSTVKWNTTEDLIEGITVDDSVNVRSSIWALIGATLTTGSVVITMPAAIKAIAATVYQASGVATIGAVAKKYQASGKTIQAAVAAADGNLVVDAYCCESAPLATQHSVGPGQIVDSTQRTLYGGTVNADSFLGIGSRKEGAASVTMKHVESVNNSRKCLAVMVLEQ